MMKLVVLTSEKEVKEEAKVLNTLFAHGLTTLHLRKPLLDIEDYQALLDEIQPEYYKHIVLHYHHVLCAQYGLKGVHLQEQLRMDLGGKLLSYVNGYQSNGFSTSSSFHKPEEIEECEVNFDYVLLSPVFDSISKKGYEGQGFNVKHLKPIVVGMGGVKENTVQKTFNLGYRGAGVLGGIWNSKDYLQSFLAMQNSCNDIVKLRNSLKSVQKHTPLKRPFVLSIAGLDPSSGAGLTADIKTMERLKCYGLSICSGNTVQNDKELSAVHWTPLNVMKAQIDSLFERFEISFVKVGIIENWLTLNNIVDYLLLKNSEIKIILDPVLSASSSFKFHATDGDEFAEVLKKIYLLTPNYLEFEKLIEGNSEQEGIANITSYCNLLLKGGHQKNNKKGRDELYLTNGKSFVFNPKREVVFEKHGSGCILSSAITSFLALEISLNKACYKGKKYTENALSSNKSLLAYHF